MCKMFDPEYQKSIYQTYWPLRRWPLREALEEALDFSVGTSAFSAGLCSLAATGSGNGSWMTMRSSLLCWPM